MSAPDGWEGILHPGESILWQGRPDARFHLTAGRIFEMIFALVFAGFALVWMVLASGAPGGFWMFGLIHFSAGVALLGHALVWPEFRRRRTWYTLTDRRAFIATDLPVQGRKLKSYPITPESQISMEYADPGSVWFAHEFHRAKRGQRRVKIGFERIVEADHVHRLLSKVQRQDDAAAQ